jgi:glycolate oxidase FAD binding subunit
MMTRDVRDGGDLLLGVHVNEIVVPATLEEATAQLSERARRGNSVAFMGGGTELGYGRAPERVDTLLRTERLSRVLEYAPADMTVTVEAGITLDALQQTLSPERQRLALDAPQAKFATIGGLLATNGFGPSRARYGSLRDLIVGVGIVRADGTLAHGGGKVVKNVAGFDLPKLMVGSLGTLGLIASATFRLHPLPERQQWYAIAGRSASEVREIVRALLEDRLEPAALIAQANADRYSLYVLFEGFGAGVESQGSELRELTAGLHGADARRIEARGDVDVAMLDEAGRLYGSVRLRISAPPPYLPALERDVLAPLRVAYGDSRTILYPTLGIAFVGGYPQDAPSFAGALQQARAAVESAGGHLVMVDCEEPAVRERFDPFGTPPPSFPIMQRLKERFDPERRLNPGRFVGGL